MSLVGNQDEFFKETGKDLRSAFTSFNELTTTSGFTLFDLKSVYGLSELRDEVEVTGTGDVTNANGLYTITTGATAGSTASLTSVERGRYVAGFEATPGIAVSVPVMPTGVQVARWGYFDISDGFGTGVDVDGFFTFLRRGGVETIHRRDEWGNAATQTIKLDKLNVYRYPFRWYGSGPIKFETSDDTQALYPDLIRYDAFSTPDGEAITEQSNLKIRAEVEGGGDFTIKVGGRQFFINGNYNPLPRFTSESRFEQSVGTTFVPLISTKQSTGTFTSVSTLLNSVNLLVAGAPILWQIRVGATVDDPTSVPSDIPAGESAMLYDNTATTITGGHKIFEDLAADAQGNSFSIASNDLPQVPLPDNRTITLCARSITGTATVSSVLSIKEEW